MHFHLCLYEKSAPNSDSRVSKNIHVEPEESSSTHDLFPCSNTDSPTNFECITWFLAQIFR